MQAVSTPLSRIDRASADQGLTLIMPAYNEAAVIEITIREGVAALRSLGIEFELLVVDDGSSDQTGDIARAVSVEFEEVHVIQHEHNRGYGAALRTGFGRATKSLIGFTDADCQFDLQELDRLLLIARDHDAACGYRTERQDTQARLLYSAIYNLLVRTLLGTHVRDCDCAMKVFRRAALEAVSIQSDGFFVDAEILCRFRQAEFSIVEVGVTHRPRLAGKSTVSLAHALPILASLLRFWWSVVMFPGRPRNATECSQRTRRVMGGGLAIVAAVLCFTNLGYPLLEPDETRYAQIALEMYETGEWVVPQLRGVPYLDKPPLLYWLICTSYRIFEPGLWSARLPSAVAGWLTILATYILGIRLVGARAAGLGALLLLFCAGFVLSSRFLIMDGALALFTTLGLLGLGLACHDPARSRCWCLFAGIALGLGVLTKGPVAVIICVPPAIAVSFLTARKRRFSTSDWLALALPIPFIAAPWYCSIWWEQPGFGGYFFIRHNLVRFFSAFDHRQPSWFYLPVLALGMFPCCLLLPAFLRYLFGRSSSLRALRTGSLGYLVAAAVWVVVFFSLSSCKLPAYILPAFPLVCLAVGKMLADMIPQPDFEPLIRTWTARAWTAALLGTAVVSPAVAVIGLGFSEFRIDEVVLAAGFITLPSLGLLWFYCGPARVWEPWPTSSLLCAAIYLAVGLYCFGNVVPKFATWRSNAHNAARLQDELGGSAPVAFLGRRADSAGLSVTGADVVEFAADELAGFEAFVSMHPLTIVVATPGCVEEIERLRGNELRLRRQGNGPRRNVYTVEPTVPFVASGEGTIQR